MEGSNTLRRQLMKDVEQIYRTRLAVDSANLRDMVPHFADDPCLDPAVLALRCPPLPRAPPSSPLPFPFDAPSYTSLPPSQATSLSVLPSQLSGPSLCATIFVALALGSTMNMPVVGQWERP